MKLKGILILIVVVSFSYVARAGQGILYYKAGFPDVAKPLLIQDLTTDTAAYAETSYFLGNIYFGENKPDSAAYYFNSGLTRKPSFAQNKVGLIMLNLKKDSVSADAEFNSILKEKANKKNIDLILSVGYAYLNNKMTSKAMFYYNKARALNNKNPLVYVLLADITAGTNIGEACSYYESAILYDQNCKEAYFKYARAYKNSNPKLAISKLNTLHEIDPNFSLVERELGDIYYATNDFQKAAENYEVYLSSGKTTTISDLTKYSMTLFLNHDFNKSLEVVNLGLQKAPGSPAFNRLAMYNNVDLKKSEEALKAADLFFNKSDNPDFTYLDFRYYGQALKDTKQTEKAAEQFLKALTYDSTKVELFKDISDLYNEIGNYSKATSAYESYYSKLKESAKTSDVTIAFGKLYYSLGKDTTITDSLQREALVKADTMFARVAAMEPNNYRGNFWRARTNSVLDPETTLGLAKPYYEKTAEVCIAKNDPRYNPIIIECYSYLGYYTLLQKDNAGSLNYWNKILAIDPNNSTANKAIKGIQSPGKSK